MDAIIFDFDGVVVDSEPVHMKAFAAVLAEYEIHLTRDEYYSNYLGVDDHDCFGAIFRVRNLRMTRAMLGRLMKTKTVMVQKLFSKSIKAQPGAVRLIKSIASGGVPLAICSGALLAEVRLAAKTVGVLDCFDTIISADHVQPGKPDPLGYRTTIKRLSEIRKRSLAPARTVVVEDAPAGIVAAKAAGMKVLAVASSYPVRALREADKIVRSLSGVTLKTLSGLVDK